MLMNPSAVTTGTGPAGARPCLTRGHLAGPRLLEEWSQMKTQSGFLPAEAVSVVLGPLRAVTHAGQGLWGWPREAGLGSHRAFFLPSHTVGAWPNVGRLMGPQVSANAFSWIAFI